MDDKDFYYVVGNMCLKGYKFQKTDLQILENPADRRVGQVMAHNMATNGVDFSVEEILALKNPADYRGNTLAHILVMKGKAFSMDELLSLRTRLQIMALQAHFMAINGFPFSAHQILTLGNPVDGLSVSIGHILASKGFKFKSIDLMRLGKGRNYLGLLPDVMASEGTSFQTTSKNFSG